MRKLLIVLIVAFVATAGSIIAVTAFKSKSIPQTTTNKWSNEAMVQAIMRDRPGLASDGRPIFDIISVSMPKNGWYIAVIKSLKENTTTVPVRIVLVESGSPKPKLTVILGPDTDFSEPDMLSSNLPDPVILELQKS